jgi:hypothetical protein
MAYEEEDTYEEEALALIHGFRFVHPIHAFSPSSLSLLARCINLREFIHYSNPVKRPLIMVKNTERKRS